MKKIKLLYLLSAFPPHGGTYTLRITKHIKYLASQGAEPTVLVPFESGGRSDESLLKDVPGECSVHRISEASLFTNFGLLLKKIWKLRNENNYDYLVTTTPDDHFIYLGALISNVFGLNWHCDLREPPRGSNTVRSRLKKSLLSSADLITSPWPPQYIFPNNNERQDQVHMIAHGFDPDDFSVASRRNKQHDSRTEFLHAGSLFEHRRNPVHFFDAIEELLQSEQVQEEEIRFRFLGGIKTETFERRMKRTVNERGLDRVVSFESFQNHSETTREMAEADVCVGFQSTDLLALKIFEYLGSRNPVLAYYGSGSPMKNLLQGKTGIHWIDYGQKDQLRETILRLHDRNNTEGPELDLRDRYNLKKSIVPKLKKLYE